MTCRASNFLTVGGITIGGGDPIEIVADIESATPGPNGDGIVVPADSTNYEIDVTLTLANAKAYGICADKDCTVKTNSSGSPTETLTLKANHALIWRENDPSTMHFLSANITKIYVTCTAETKIKFGHASDITPA